MVLPLTLHAILAYAISFFYVSVLRVVSVCRIYCTRIRSFNRRPKFNFKVPELWPLRRTNAMRGSEPILSFVKNWKQQLRDPPPQVSGLYPRGLCEKARWRSLLLCMLRLNPVLQYNRLGSSC